MAMMLRSLTLACFASLAAAINFGDVGEVSAEDAEAALLSQLDGAFGPSPKKDRLDKLEAALRPTFASLPKNQDGNLDHSVVRYALHRLFLQQHGWFIRGLEPSRTDAANASVSGNLSGQVPSFLQGLIERRLHNDVHLRHLAVLAATLEDIVHKEAVSRLKAVYAGLRIPRTKMLDAIHSNSVLDTYMVVFLLGGELSSESPEDLRAKVSFKIKGNKDWHGIMKWEHEVLTQVGGRAYQDGNVSFATATKVVEQIGERFGTFNDGECADLKHHMLSFESTKAGRVRLSDFYNNSMHSYWKYTEKVDYLRALGSLDESNPEELHVIVPNYVLSRPNCLSSSNFFEVCCRNECEDLMSHLEHNIVGPTAPVSRIAALVANLPSATVTAPRTLSPSLLLRLNEIAEGNRGRVPLHGRLFAQWIHHAFPRECPFPHTDATSPQTPDEWMASNEHLGTQASEEEMMVHVCVAPSGEVQVDTELPWIGEERLLVSQPVPQQAPSQTPMPDQTPTAPPSSVSPQNFSLFFLAVLMFGILASVGLARFVAVSRVQSTTDVLEAMKNAQTGEVPWSVVCPLLLLTFGAFVVALVHEFAVSAPKMSDVASVALICAACAALMALIVQQIARGSNDKQASNYGFNSLV